MKAIALLSGGLDSTLAAKIIRDLQIEMVALHTVSPFCLCDHRSPSGCASSTAAVAKEFGLKLVTVNVADEFLEIVRKPKHGYGSHMNPCIDCRILLFKKAKELMKECSASFVITGEVVGQRPMSQRKDTMRLIENESGLTGLVLRPLSAKVLEPTIPEQRGWVERNKLLAINGRGRREQMGLAKEFGIHDYPCPSGGCLLTDPRFSVRLKDLMRYGEMTLKEVALLKIGRHFRISEHAKLIVGRDEKENEALSRIAQEEDYLLYPDEVTAGATSLTRGEISDELLALAARITGRYFDLHGNPEAEILCKKAHEQEARSINVSPLPEEELVRLRI